MNIETSQETHQIALSVIRYIDHLYQIKAIWKDVSPKSREDLAVTWAHRIAAEQMIEKDALISAHNAAKAMLDDLLSLPEFEEHYLRADTHPRHEALCAVITHQMTGIIFSVLCPLDTTSASSG